MWEEKEKRKREETEDWGDGVYILVRTSTSTKRPTKHPSRHVVRAVNNTGGSHRNDTRTSRKHTDSERRHMGRSRISRPWIRGSGLPGHQPRG